MDISSSVTPTDGSDKQSTSLLSAQTSDDGDSYRLRKYRERKLRKLVDKCHCKNIRFMQYYVRISTKMANNPESCSNVELLELTTQCLQSSGSDYKPSGESSSSNSFGEPLPKKKKIKKAFLTPSPQSFDKTNPYNQAWSQSQFDPCSQGIPFQHNVLIGGVQRHSTRLTLQQQHEIFQSQVYGNQPSLEVCPLQALPPFPVFTSGHRFLNQPHYVYNSAGCSPGSAVNPNIFQPQRMGVNPNIVQSQRMAVNPNIVQAQCMGCPPVQLVQHNIQMQIGQDADAESVEPLFTSTPVESDVSMHGIIPDQNEEQLNTVLFTHQKIIECKSFHLIPVDHQLMWC